MSTRQISIVVQRDGSSTLQTHGIGGPGCQAASRFLERALGRSTQESLTSEYYQSSRVDQTRTCRQTGHTGNVSGGS